MKCIHQINGLGHRGMSLEMVETTGLGHVSQKTELLRSKVRVWSAQASRVVSGLLANRYVILALRWITAGVFIASSCGKLVDIGRYSIAPIMEFGILPAPLAHLFGTVLPFIEAICALGLLFGVFTRLSSLGILAMSASFFIAKEVVLWQGGDIACGCFGAIVTTLASLTVYLDPPLMLMALAVLLAPRSSRHWISLAGRLPESHMDWVERVW